MLREKEKGGARDIFISEQSWLISKKVDFIAYRSETASFLHSCEGCARIFIFLVDGGEEKIKTIPFGPAAKC